MQKQLRRDHYYGLSSAVAGLMIATMGLISACGDNGSTTTTPASVVPSGFDPCHDIPLNMLNAWGVDPTPKPATSIESDGSNSTNPALKSCRYSGQVNSSKDSLTIGDELYIGFTTMSPDYFRQQIAGGKPYHLTKVDGRTTEVMGPTSYSNRPGPASFTTCEYYVEVKGGGLMLNVNKTGDACQFMVGLAPTVVRLLPPES